MSETSQLFPAATSTEALEHGDLFTPRFNADGLIPAICTDVATGEVVMFAWMNSEALQQTLRTGEAHFYSRSRSKLWKKGEESGNVLMISEIATDCDQDVIWLKVTVTGAGKACHTGARTCFYRRVIPDAANPTRSTLKSRV